MARPPHWKVAAQDRPDSPDCGPRRRCVNVGEPHRHVRTRVSRRRGPATRSGRPHRGSAGAVLRSSRRSRQVATAKTTPGSGPVAALWPARHDFRYTSSACEHCVGLRVCSRALWRVDLNTRLGWRRLLWTAALCGKRRTSTRRARQASWPSTPTHVWHAGWVLSATTATWSPRRARRRARCSWSPTIPTGRCGAGRLRDRLRSSLCCASRRGLRTCSALG